MNVKALIASAVVATVLTTTAGADGHGADHVAAPEAKNIVEIAAANDDFETLVAAVSAAGLADTLQGAGPFTLFAPTDAAFAALPAGTLENLLKPENKDELVKILTYHVVPGLVNAKAVAGLKEATTVQGNNVTVTSSDGAVMIDGAKVVAADIEASNGVIHVIDQVIAPKS